MSKYVIPMSVLVVAIFGTTETAWADNCGSLSDCYGVVKSAAIAAGLIAVFIGLALDFTPITGNIKGIVEALNAHDAARNQKAECWEKLLDAIFPRNSEHPSIPSSGEITPGNPSIPSSGEITPGNPSIPSSGGTNNTGETICDLPPNNNDPAVPGESSNIFFGGLLMNQKKKEENITQNITGNANSVTGKIDKIEGNLNVSSAIGSPEPKPDMAEVAAEIQLLLKQLEQTYPTTTTSQQMIVAVEAINRIESNSTLKKRVINAVTEGSLAAFEKAIDNPAGAFIVTAIKRWQETETK